MGLFDQLENAPEAPKEDVIRRNTQSPSLEAPEVAPETPEEVMMVARTVRKQVQKEEGIAFGNPVDLAEQFNNTLIGAIGGSADMVAWAGRKAMTTLGASEETAQKFFASGNTEFIKSGTKKLGIGSDREADTFLGHTGDTIGEAALFLAGGAGVVQKTKQLKNFVGGISRQADVALKTKLGTVVAGEAAVSVGAAGGRQIAEENEFGAAGSMATEFATGALALVSAAGAKKAVLDPLTAKLKNMTSKEALEKLSKEEVAEVVAEGQRVIAKKQPAPKKTPDPEAPETPKLETNLNPKKVKSAKETGGFPIQSVVVNGETRYIGSYTQEGLGRRFYFTDEKGVADFDIDGKDVSELLTGEKLSTTFDSRKELLESLQKKVDEAPEAPATPKDTPEAVATPEATPAPEGSVTVFRGEDGRFSGADSEGTFFSADKDVAAGYGNVTESRLELESPMTFDFDGRSRVFFDGAERSPSELSKRLKEINDDLAEGFELDEDLVAEMETLGFSSNFDDSIDGLILKNVDDPAEGIGTGKTATNYVVFDNKKIKNTPKSTPEDAIDASIAATKSILEGDRTGGKGARVTAEVKPHFKAVAVEMSDQFNAFAGAKNADDAMGSAKEILARIDRFIDFDRIIAKKDYAQGSELVANAGHTTPDSFKAGITAEANQRTADLQTLKNMLEDFTGGAVAKNADEVAEAVAKGADEAAEGALEAGSIKGAVTLEDAQSAAADMAKKLTPEEKLTAIRSQMAQISRSRSTGPLMSLFDGYFTARTAMALNQVKTGLVGTMSASIKHFLTPLENTFGAVDGAFRLKDTTFRRRFTYALADIAATTEYLGTFKNHWRALGMNMRNTMLETGDSQLLYKEAQAYKGQEGITTQHTNFFARRNLNRALRTEAYNNATNPIDKSYKGLRKAVLNNNVADAIPLIFNYGFGLIGSIEEISLMTLSRRAQKSMAIKQGVREGAEDIGKYVDDWMNDAFMKQEDGSMRINYDPKYADGFNEARYDHFRSLDIPASDIRVEAEHSIVAALNKVAESPTEVGMITKFIMMFRGVPTRAGAQLLAYTPPVAAYRVGKIGARKLASAGEGLVGEGNVSFGKYASKIGELKADIKRSTKLLDDPNTSADVRKEAEALIAQSDEQIARLETYQRADDYRDIARSLVATGIFLMGYEHGRSGITTGSQSHLTNDQKFAAQKVDGAPNDWKVRWGELELDYRYAEPLKGSYGMGASWGARQAAIDSGNITPEQTATQFFVSAYRDMFLDMPALQGAKTIVQATSANPETRAKAGTGLIRQAIPAPAEIRNILKYDEEFIGDTTSGDRVQTAWRAAIGTEQDNYRLTVLGEPKQKEGQTLMGHLTPFGGKETVERTDLDNILLEDAMSFRSLSEIQTSVSGFQLKKFVHVDDDNGETLYSKFGQLITTTKIGGKNQRKALEKLIKTRSFKNAYKLGYSQNEQGQDINEGIEMMKDIMSEYRAEAREIILNSKAATDYVNSDGSNIYDILKEREAFSAKPESLLESLNLK